MLGEISLLPERVRLAAEKVMEMTKDYDQFYLNICMPYGSMHEMQRALKLYHQNSAFPLSTRTAFKFEDYLYTRDLPDIDVVLRTSGESRLSDFLLWQVSQSVE